LALRLGLEAASILLFIVTSPGVELRVVSEDAIDSSFTLLRHHLSKNVIPALNNSGHLLATQAMEEETGIASPRKRKRKSTGGGEGNAVVRELKKVYRHIVSMMELHLILMDRVETAAKTVFLDDQQILTVTSAAMDALEIEAALSSQNAANRLQMATIGLVTAVFRKFPMHRGSIIEDIFPLMLKIPTSKRSMRAYSVRYNSCPSPQSTQNLTTSLFSNMLTNGQEPHYIQMITALILSLIQSCVVRPTFISSSEANNKNDESEDEESHQANNNDQYPTKLASGLRGCQVIADAFAIQMLQRCSRKGEDGGASEFRPVLCNLVEDLLLVLMIPEYAAAQMLLLSCTHVLSRDIIIASQISNNPNSENTIESTYVNTAFDTLGRICSAYAKVIASQREQKFQTEVTVVPDNRKHLRCYCKRNDWTDTLMLDCDNCHIWYHAQCIGMNREALPNEWICDACTLQKMLSEERETDGGRSIVDPLFVMNRVLETHLKSLRGFRNAAQFHLAKWAEELERQSLSKDGRGNTDVALYHQAIGQIIERWDTGSFIVARSGRSTQFCFTEEGGIRALLLLTTSYSNFTKSFNAQMGLMLKLMSDKAHASLRKLSVKAIEKVRGLWTCLASAV
jgi:cohesin loading factor subunit SCC2